MKKDCAYIGKKIREAGNKLPCHDAKARFAIGAKVELRSMWVNSLLYQGVVTGAGNDERGEYQDVKLTYPRDRAEQIKRFRLMDLDLLQEI